MAVDLEVDGGRLGDVSVSGDFFLEPDDALDDINAALRGMPVETRGSTSSPRRSRGARRRVALIGFTPEAVGIAVRRALGKATGWHDHAFDVIPRVLHPAMHVALDEVIAARGRVGARPPTLRFWDWDSPLVVIGSFQSVRNEVDPDGADRHHIDVVRRVSGGGAMFMEPGNCITYSLVVPGSLVEGLSFERSYSFLDDWVIGALADVGVAAHFVPLNDIASDAGKIGGAAQKRFADGTVLHHVTMSYDIDADKMLEVLRIGREKMSDKGTARPTSASTRCARRPACHARPSSTPSPPRSRALPDPTHRLHGRGARRGAAAGRDEVLHPGVDPPGAVTAGDTRAGVRLVAGAAP